MKTYDVLNALRDAPGLTAGEKWVLVCVQSRAGDGGSCFTSVATLARDSSFGATAVRGHLRSLVTKGYLIAETRAGDSTSYRVDPTGFRTPSESEPHRNPVPTPPESDGVPHRNPVPTPPESGAYSFPDSIQDSIPETNTEPVRVPDPVVAAPPPPAEQRRRWFDPPRASDGQQLSLATAIRPANPTPKGVAGSAAPPPSRRKKRTEPDPELVIGFAKCQAYITAELHRALKIQEPAPARNSMLGGRLWKAIQEHGVDNVLAAMQWVVESRGKRATWLRQPGSDTTLKTVLNNLEEYAQLARSETAAIDPSALWDSPAPVSEETLAHFERIAAANGGKI